MQFQILLIAFTVTVISSTPKKFTPVQFQGSIPMVWIDGRNRELDGTPETDTFFDRIVSIGFYYNDTHKYSNFASGVYITNLRVLTSFNAFKDISKNKGALQHMAISSLKERVINNYPQVAYFFTHTRIECARQVIPWHEETVSIDMKHGPHRPHHDLMILRMAEFLEALRPIPKALTELFKSEITHKSGPVFTIVATMDDMATDNLRFASLGHIDDAHIRDARYLEKEEIHPDDDAIADCDEWIPREWGRFICILNVNNYAGLASGAMLFSRQRLVGVGSFALWKGEKGVLIFTDVRPYRDLLFLACSKDDQNLVVPNSDL